MQNPPSGGAPAAAEPIDAATESLGAPSPADPPAVKAAALSPRARRAAAVKAVEKKPVEKKPVEKKPARKPRKKWVQDEGGGFVHKREAPDLRADLRAFVTAQPGGWGHDDWIAFLDHLRERGHDTSDPEAIGLALERERLAATLERIVGMGPRRVQAVVERYDTLWSACRADVDEIAALPGMNRSLAEKVRQALA